jgi:FAD/FMN-containing dehydrogenase
MNRLDSSQRSRLRAWYGDRVTFSRVERIRCGHDSATAPPPGRPTIGETVPDAVVLPESEEELQELVRWAMSEGVALTPRGRGTSRSGGAIPLRRGVTVDFTRMRRLIDLDPGSRTVTVEPGLVWLSLQVELASAGLALRLYPTSLAGSTVGGWLAQGGAGIGSFEAGWFRENVESVRIAVPEEGIVRLDGPDLGLVADAEGTTGLISRVTLRVDPDEVVYAAAAATPDPLALQRMLEGVVEADLPLWSVSFFDPVMASFHGGTPEEYLVAFAYRRAAAPWVESRLPWIVTDSGGWVVDDDLAGREWVRRFRMTRIRERFPSLVPAEIVVPLTALSDVLEEIEAAIESPTPMEAVLVRSEAAGPEVALHVFLPVAEEDESRKAAVGGLLAVLGIAEDHGGRPYSTGIYFRDRAGSILGWERVRAMESFRRRIDPRGILNPGKVMGPGRPGSRLSLARTIAGWAERVGW